MNTLLNLKRIFFQLLLLLAVIEGEFAFAASLEENSPFVPFDYVSGQTELPMASEKGGVELRGILDFGDEPRFSLYNSKTQESVWVNFKDQKARYYIDDYDPQKKLIVITINGLRQQLKVSKPLDEPVKGGAATRGLMNLPGMQSRNEPEAIAEDEEEDGGDEDAEEVPEDEAAQKRKEMSERVYKAFQQYVSEKRGETAAP